MPNQQEKIRELLSAYVDGETSPEQSRQVESAVKSDPRLAAELKQLRAVAALLRGLPREEPPEDLTTRIQARAERARLLERSGHRAGRTADWYLARLAAAAAIIVVAVVVGAAVVAWVMAPSYLDRDKVNLARAPQPTKVERLAEARPVEPASPVAKPAGAALVAGKVGLAGGDRKSVDAELAAGDVMNMIINTDDVATVQKQVEEVFRDNGVRLMDESELAPAGEVAAKMANDEVQPPVEQVRYDAMVSAGQFKQIISGLNEIQSRQNVAQAPIEIVPADAAERAKLADGLAYTGKLGAVSDRGDTRERYLGKSGGRGAELTQRPAPEMAAREPAPAPAAAPPASAPAATVAKKATVNEGLYIAKGEAAKPPAEFATPTSGPSGTVGSISGRINQPTASRSEQQNESKSFGEKGQQESRQNVDALWRLQREALANNTQLALRSRNYGYAVQTQAASTPTSAPIQINFSNRSQAVAQRQADSAPADQQRQLVITINNVLPTGRQRR